MPHTTALAVRYLRQLIGVILLSSLLCNPGSSAGNSAGNSDGAGAAWLRGVGAKKEASVKG